MPTIKVNDVDIYYEDSAPNNTQKPVIVFAHGLLWSSQMYDKQVEYFQTDYRCIAFDFRGQGQSQITKSGYDMETLTEDTLGLLDALGIDKCHFVGLSMGGFVAQRIALGSYPGVWVGAGRYCGLGAYRWNFGDCPAQHGHLWQVVCRVDRNAGHGLH